LACWPNISWVDKRKQVDVRDFYAALIFFGGNPTKRAFFKKTGEFSPAGIRIA
jgi:hypothetical protein